MAVASGTGRASRWHPHPTGDRVPAGGRARRSRAPAPRGTGGGSRKDTGRRGDAADSTTTRRDGGEQSRRGDPGSPACPSHVRASKRNTRVLPNGLGGGFPLRTSPPRQSAGCGASSGGDPRPPADMCTCSPRPRLLRASRRRYIGRRRPPTVLGRERGGGASLLRQRPRGGTPRAETPSGAAARSWARAGGFFRPRFAHRALSCAAQGLQLTPACTWGGRGPDQQRRRLENTAPYQREALGEDDWATDNPNTIVWPGIVDHGSRGGTVWPEEWVRP